MSIGQGFNPGKIYPQQHRSGGAGNLFFTLCVFVCKTSLGWDGDSNRFYTVKTVCYRHITYSVYSLLTL